VDALYRGSHAFRALAVRLDWFGFRGDVDPEGRNRDAIGENNVVDGLRLFAELAREHGFDPVVAIWPRFDDERIEDPAPMPGREETSVFEVLAEADGLPSFRFSPGFRRELAASGAGEGPRRRYTIGDRLHPNPFGADLAAAILAEELPRVRRPVGPARAPDPAAVALARELGDRLGETDRAPDSRRWVNTGNELLADGRTAEAIEAYRRALASDPALVEAHHNLGIALRREGRLEEAFSEFLESVRLDPELVEGHRNLGVTLLAMGRPADAIRPLTRAVELAPRDALAMEALQEASRRAAKTD
jgi:tetratricopeptide (TPR) repeat protein